MKADYRRKFLERLAEVLLDEMPAKVAAIRLLHPEETILDIQKVYINEEDHNKLVLMPCLILFSHGPKVLDEMAGAITYEFPVDICPFDKMQASSGIPALYNRLYDYEGCVADLLLSSHGYEAGYWNDVHPLGATDPQYLEERFGTLGKAEGHQYSFQTTISYP
jgi:hypothetical protein